MRFEYKYVVPIDRLDTLRQDILPYTTLDAYTLHRKDHQYTVRSIYFDTARLTAYCEKIEGIRVRKKLRVRAYNSEQEGGTAFLEIKSKIDQRGMKQRSPLRADDVPAFFSTHAVEDLVLAARDREAALNNARRFLFHYIRCSMMPVILVTYEREAFQGQFDASLRITFDKHLRYQVFPALKDLYRESGLKHLAPRFFIVEIKFGNAFAPWLQAIVRKHGLTRISVSKYGSCVTTSGVACSMVGAMADMIRQAPALPLRTEVIV